MSWRPPPRRSLLTSYPASASAESASMTSSSMPLTLATFPKSSFQASGSPCLGRMWRNRARIGIAWVPILRPSSNTDQHDDLEDVSCPVWTEDQETIRGDVVAEIIGEELGVQRHGDVAIRTTVSAGRGVIATTQSQYDCDAASIHLTIREECKHGTRRTSEHSHPRVTGRHVLGSTVGQVALRVLATAETNSGWFISSRMNSSVPLTYATAIDGITCTSSGSTPHASTARATAVFAARRPSSAAALGDRSAS